jgi:peroxiredoxin
VSVGVLGVAACLLVGMGVAMVAACTPGRGQPGQGPSPSVPGDGRLSITDPRYGDAPGVPELGEIVEDLELLTIDGLRLRTDELRRTGHLALLFYPGRQMELTRPWLERFQDALGELDAAGIALVAVSTDPPERGLELADELGLTFPVAADPRVGVTASLGLRDPERPARARVAVLLVDAQGTLVYRKVGGRPAEPRELVYAARGESLRCCPDACAPACLPPPLEEGS